MLIKILSVFGLGMIGLWEGIPAGFGLRLHPVVIGGVAALGSTFATLLVLVLGDRVRARLVRPRALGDGAKRERMPQRERLIDRVWRRYGIIGLGLLAPGLTGAPLGVAFGLLLRAPAGKLLSWSILGIALWSVALTLAGTFARNGVLHLMSR